MASAWLVHLVWASVPPASWDTYLFLHRPSALWSRGGGVVRRETGCLARALTFLFVPMVSVVFVAAQLEAYSPRSQGLRLR